MHIQPGFIVQSKIIAANFVALGVLGTQIKPLLKQPIKLAQTLVVAVFFCLFMEMYFQPVGPSELHFVGAIAMYVMFGFTPTLVGFALGLLLQGTFFMPTDLVHLSVNSLSLMLPLILMHGLRGRFLNGGAKTIRYRELVKLDGIYYTGVTCMVGFWLLGESVTNLSSWATFAVSYVPVVFGEALFSLSLVALIKRFPEHQLLKGAAGRLGLA